MSIIGATVVVGGYYWIKIRPRLKLMENPYWGSEPSRAKSLDAQANPGSEFDLKLALPGGPYGLAWDGRRFLTCKRDDPWGLLEITPEDDGDWTTRQIPVVEATYAQRISLDGITWNGTEFVAIANGSWFQQNDGIVFVVLDPATLRITKTVPAPQRLGAIVWDGARYWAATRNNTRDSGETPRLYELDAELEVVAEHAPPSIGCQGLAWDGRYLWWVDVFSDAISIVDVSGDRPEVVHSWSGPLEYLSGVAWDGRAIWIADYGENAIRRLKGPTLAAWIGGRVPSAGGQVSQPVPIVSDPADVAALRKDLRSDDWAKRMHARFALRERGLGVDYDRRQESSPEPDSPSKIDLDDFSLEIRDDKLVASWDAWIGDDYISGTSESTSGAVTMPLFARYSVTVRSGALSSEIEKEYVARAGRNAERDVVFVDGVKPGTYSASFFIHVQYVDKTEGAKILNLNEASLEVEQK
ncbi:MAG: hypothetical protein HYU52_16545 [Acidobacteria bacterium]|nr:hypothetical protein [Acidobacteriota bacterium]